MLAMYDELLVPRVYTVVENGMLKGKGEKCLRFSAGKTCLCHLGYTLVGP